MPARLIVIQRRATALQRVALAPTEVKVRDLAGHVAQVQQEGRDGVRHRWAFGVHDAVALDVHSPHFQRAGELGGSRLKL